MRAAISLLVSLLHRSFGALRGGPAPSKEHAHVCDKDINAWHFL